MSALPIVGFLPEGILLGAALLVFLLDAAELRKNEWLGGIAVVGILGALLLVVADLGVGPLAALRTLPASVVDAPAGPTDLFAFSSLGLVFQAIFLLSGLLVSLASLS